MFDRALQIPLGKKKSFFLLGPRSTGKTFFLKNKLPNAIYIDLLDGENYSRLLSSPNHLDNMIPKNYDRWVIIDEIQRVPQLLNEVHRLIEQKQYRFILTGSSARKLRRDGVNLLAGRALTYFMHPLIIQEIGEKFDFVQALKTGLLPPAVQVYPEGNEETDPKKFLSSYVSTYLREEVLQEGLTRNIDAFSKFLEVASFSQGSTLNKMAIAREAHLKKTTVSNYFEILKDLLISYELPVFTRRAKRATVQHAKFYFFDVGVYQTLRPKGILDSADEIEGTALETLFLQSLRAVNDYYNLGYKLYYWRTTSGIEVDFVLYGENGLHAFEIKRKSRITKKDAKVLYSFGKDYPEAKLHLVCGENKHMYLDDVHVHPFLDALKDLPEILKS